ncbi:Mur ligase family protein [Streptomyces sp. NPDC004752]
MTRTRIDGDSDGNLRFVEGTVLVDASSDDSIALAEYLAGIGHHVVALASDQVDFEAHRGRLGDIGIAVRDRSGDDADLRGIDTVFIDTFTSPQDSLVTVARRRGIRFSNLPDVVLRAASPKTIGITGSAGKTTTTFLLSALLRAAGQPVHASTDHRVTPSGPGREVLDNLASADPGSWTVLELGSRHFDYMTVSPHISVVTNFFPDHLDWHGGLDAYRAAKQRILQFQTTDDFAVLNHDDPMVREHFGTLGHARRLHFSESGELEHGVVVMNGDVVVRSLGGDDIVCPLDALALPRHQLGSALAATAAAMLAGASIPAIRDTLCTFTGVAQRGQLAGDVNGVEVYDDSLAMNPRKALSGMESLRDRSVVLVAGGSLVSPSGERRVNSALEQADLRLLCAEILRKATSVVLFGDGGELIAQLLRDIGAGTATLTLERDFRCAVEHAIDLAAPGGKVLISPVYHTPPLELKATLDAVLGVTEE